MTVFVVDHLDEGVILEMDTGVQWRLRDAGEQGVNDRVWLSQVGSSQQGHFSKDGLQRMHDEGVLEIISE